MSDLNTQVTTPEATGQEPTAQAPATPATTVQNVARQELANKYQQLYQPSGEPVTPAEAAPAATPEPVAPAPEADLKAVLTALTDRLAALETSRSAAPPAAPAEQATPQQVADWLSLLQEGKKEEAEAALAGKLGVQSPESIITAAVEQMRVEQDLNEYTRKVQADNADIADMEPYISAMVGFEANQKFAGKRPTPTEYSVFYKDAVARHVADARKLVLGFRGQGATNATTRTTQVLAQPTFVPQPVNTNRETPTQVQAPEAPQDYIAARQARNAADRGLTPRA